jgi:hypothetical protein
MVDIIQNLGIQVKIINNYLSLFQASQAFNSEKTNIARTGAY